MLGMMNCKEAGRLVSEKRDRKLPMGKLMRLRMHLSICQLCKIYSRQIELLGEISRKASTMVLQSSFPFTLSADAKARIKAKVSE